MKRIWVATVLATLLTLTACTNQSRLNENKGNMSELKQKKLSGKTPTELVRVVSPNIYQNPTTLKEVVRYDRYMLVEPTAQNGQKFLLDQLVSINIKNNKSNQYNVEYGLRTTLKDTGFALCSAGFNRAISLLYSRPLPKIHYNFGPMRLSDAIQMLAGPAYEVTIEYMSRTICFNYRDLPKVKVNMPILISSVIEKETTTTIEEK